VASNQSATLNPRAPLARAEVNYVGDGWLSPGGKAAPGTNVGLGVTATQQQAMYPPSPTPPPPPPTEAELRAKLADALDAQKATDEAARQAEAAHERAEQHLSKCQQRVAQYLGLDDIIAAATVDALRSGATGRAELSEKHELALTDRERARTEMQAAERAVATFRQERAAAAQAAGDAIKLVDLLVAKVLAFTAGSIADAARIKLAEVEAARRTLIAYDKMATPLRIPSPPAIYAVTGVADAREVFISDVTPWTRAADALRADPHANVSVEIPPAIVQPIPGPMIHSGVVPAPGRIERAAPTIDDGDQHYLPEEETSP
jgi:hypothetical protein